MAASAAKSGGAASAAKSGGAASAAKSGGAASAAKSGGAASAAKSGGAASAAKSGGAASADNRKSPRLKERYARELRGQLLERLGLRNIMEVPRLEKIVINMGVGRATQQPSLLEGAVADLTV